MPDMIVTHRLTKYYDRRRVVDSLDLRVAQGVVYGLLGRNGAGKSTLIKMLLGMVHPDYGRAEVLGEESLELRPQTRARIAYLAEGHPLVSLDDRRRGRALHPRVLSPTGTAACWSRSSIISSFRGGPRSAGSPTASGPRSRWPWPWPPIPSC